MIYNRVMARTDIWSSYDIRRSPRGNDDPKPIRVEFMTNDFEDGQLKTEVIRFATVPQALSYAGEHSRTAPDGERITVFVDGVQVNEPAGCLA